VVGANLPDLDIVAAFGPPLADLEWRRGWTHGILALLILPILLTLALRLIHKFTQPRAGSPPLRQHQLLLLATFAVSSHPVLDTLNTYGVRWLMPFSGQWFYGDALFIIDPWVWLTLGAGAWWSWRRRKGAGTDTRPARWAVTLFGSYAAIMWVSSAAARSIINDNLEARIGRSVRTAMAGPLPITPFSRSFVAAEGDDYLVGTFHWLTRPMINPGAVQRFPRARPTHPAFGAALSQKEFRRFLGWARFPIFKVVPAGGPEYLVHAVDLRYAQRPGARFGSLTMRVTLPSEVTVVLAAE
jgi:inner membrane protein